MSDALLNLFTTREIREVRREKAVARKNFRVKGINEQLSQLNAEKAAIMERVYAGNASSNDFAKLQEIRQYVEFLVNEKKRRTVKERELIKTLRKSIREDTKVIRRILGIDENIEEERVVEALRQDNPYLATVVVTTKPAKEGRRGKYPQE